MKKTNFYKMQTIERHKTLTRHLLYPLLLTVILLPSTLDAQTLVWEDHFNSGTINEDVWTFDFGDGCERGICGWGNSELQYYTSRPENARIENGNLVIEARREAFQGKEFTSARLKTEGRLHFKYGTLEARIKVPNLQNGLWPAFWMLGTIGSWPANGEIDIMEMGSAAAIQAGLTNKKVGAAVHWSYNGSQADYDTDYDSPVKLNEGYHIYKMVWDPQFIKIYINDIEFFAFDISDIAQNSLEEFHIPHYIILNLAVGGTYTGILSEAGITAPMPGQMLVDYIKLYQNSQDELYLASQHAESGNFGVYTENTPISDALTFGTNADLYIWNNLTPISTAPYEGSEALAFRASAGQWFGLGISNEYKNMSNFYEGELRFHMKTTTPELFKIGISTGHGDSWIDFVNGGEQYGLVRDGNWHEVAIPFSAFHNLDLYSVKQMFMLTGGPYGSDAEIFIDNIYYSGGGTSNLAPQVAITSPSNNATYDAGSTITISAQANDSDGTITLVEFFSNGIKIGEAQSSPFVYAWNDAPTGEHVLTASATDNSGATTTSSPISITIEGNNSNGFPIPGRVQAEDYSAMHGVQTENTTDDGNGENVGWIDNGDWMEYQIDVATSGTYTVNLRAASLAGGGVLEIQSGNTTLATVHIGATGDWQNWTTLSTNTNLSAGEQTLRLYAHSGGFNLNWLDFSLGSSQNDGCSFTAYNGDYTTEVSDAPNNPTITFSPSQSGIGNTTAILYYGTSAQGMLPGYPVTPDIPYQINAAPGQTIYFYYTYNVPGGGERNTANHRHSFVVGNCTTTGSTLSGSKRAILKDEPPTKAAILYPNPTNGWAIVPEQFLGGEVTVLDGAGKRVMKAILSSTQLDMTHLPEGIYMVSITKDGHTVNKRIIKE